ncbi:hypothetical protein AMTRI_Chr02g254100 [Amborella trichopoda]
MASKCWLISIVVIVALVNNCGAARYLEKTNNEVETMAPPPSLPAIPSFTMPDLGSLPDLSLPPLPSPKIPTIPGFFNFKMPKFQFPHIPFLNPSHS